MVAAKSASVGQENPVQSLFQGVPDANASKLHGPAMWTLWIEHRAFRATVGELAKRLQGSRWNAGAAAFSCEQPRP